jgi:hypothetical protein
MFIISIHINQLLANTFVGKGQLLGILELEKQLQQHSMSVSSQFRKLLHDYLQTTSSSRFPIEELSFCKVKQFSAVCSLPEQLTNSQRCYASWTVFNGRFDSIQISGPDGKWFGKLLAVFQIAWRQADHSLALILNYDFVDNNKPFVLDQPWVQLTQQCTIVPVDAIDLLVQLHPVSFKSYPNTCLITCNEE